MKIFSILIFTLFLSLNSQAGSENNFYCGEFTAGGATYSEAVFKGCKDGVQEARGVCTQTALCVFLTDEIKKDLQETYPKRDVLALTEEEKKAYFSKKHQTDWVTTTLTCLGVKNSSGQALCPMPEKCKGDLYFDVKPALMNQSEYDEVLKRYQSGNPRSFPVRYETNGKVEKAE